MVNGRLVGVAALVVSLAGLAACGAAAPSSGTPAGSPPGGSPRASASTPALAAVQPCGVLGRAQIKQNDLTGQEASTGSGARSCTWSNDSFDSGMGYAVEVDIRDSQGLKDINTAGYTVTNDPVGRHPGRQAQQTSGDGCFVAIGVSPTSRVDVSSETAASVRQACMLANQFAKLIEPKLP